MGYALKFTTRLSFNGLWKTLNKIGPWRWRASDSDNYGDTLWCVTEDDNTLTIFAAKPNWIIQVGVPLNDSAAREAIDRVLTERIFPAISATDIEPTDTVR